MRERSGWHRGPWAGAELPGSRRGVITTGTAIALGAIAGTQAATQIASAKMGSNAARDAARIQERAANQAANRTSAASLQALDLQREQYDRGAAALQPYVNLGTGSLSRLASGMGLPALTSGAPPAGANVAPAPGGAAVPRVVGRGATPAAVRSGRSLADLGRMTPASAIAPSTVRMVAPDGTPADVPVDQVAHYLARGARRLDAGAVPANTSVYA